MNIKASDVNEAVRNTLGEYACAAGEGLTIY
jgi:hypothetical protein